VSTAAVVQSAFLAVALIFVGALLYKEAITMTKVAGVLICLVGLYFINK
jgi:drug/metabolite transporter (DMT)-like permease